MHSPARCLAALIAVWFALPLPAAIQAAEKPNIVFVLTDDQGPWTVGASGNQQAHTPNFDRLVREGAYLVNYFTPTPVCSPARASLMASRYGSELGITDWINDKVEPEVGLDPALATWPEVLAQSGYTNGLVGKWHLGVLERFHPTKTGFSYFMGFRGGGTVLLNPTLELDGRPKQFRGFTVDILTDHALQFIRTTKDRPSPVPRSGRAWASADRSFRTASNPASTVTSPGGVRALSLASRLISGPTRMSMRWISGSPTTHRRTSPEQRLIRNRTALSGPRTVSCPPSPSASRIARAQHSAAASLPSGNHAVRASPPKWVTDPW